MTKGPSRLKSGWPKDKRPPKRAGKPAGAPTKQRQSPPSGTSLSGKPNGAAFDPSAIPSSDAPRPKRGRKSKGKVEQPEQKFEKRTLSTREQQEMALRAVRITVEARRRERALKRETKAERDAIKELRARAETLETQADQGFELVPEGDLFGDTAQSSREPAETIGGGPEALSPAGADEALRKIAGANGKNGAASPHLSHADAVENIRKAATDDLDNAARRDLAESKPLPVGGPAPA